MIKLYYQIADISAYHLKSKELIQSSMEYIVKYFGSNHQYWLKYIELLKVVLQLSNEKDMSTLRGIYKRGIQHSKDHGGV